MGLHEGTAELVLRIGLQRANEDQFGRAVARAVAPCDATTALGLAQTAPVGRAVHRARKALRIDEGFEQQQRLREMRQPVSADTALTQRKHFGAQIGVMPLGQDQKPAVVGDELESTILVSLVPANPAVTRRAFQRRRRKAQ